MRIKSIGLLGAIAAACFVAMPTATLADETQKAPTVDGYIAVQTVTVPTADADILNYAAGPAFDVHVSVPLDHLVAAADQAEGFDELFLSKETLVLKNDLKSYDTVVGLGDTIGVAPETVSTETGIAPVTVNAPAALDCPNRSVVAAVVPVVNDSQTEVASLLLLPETKQRE